MARKKYFVIAGILLLCFAGWGLYLFNKPHTSVQNIKASETIAATDLYKQYAANENAANQEFLDKVIEVKGKVSDAQKTDSSFSVLLNAGAATGGVNCNLSFNDNKKIPLPKQGDFVTIKGECAGFLMDVTLVDCVLEK
ncbi:MAG: OB-fold protein [Chitinophagaceae bacterium]